MWLAGGIGAVAAILLAVFASPLLTWLGADAATLPHALAYLRFSAPGLIGMFVVLAATGTLRGFQDTRTPLIAASVGAAFNAVANWVLMYPLGLGVAGSGLGDGAHADAHGALSRWDRRSIRPPRGCEPQALHVRTFRLGRRGDPLLIRTIALRVALLATLSAVTSISTQALATHQIVWTLWSFAAYVLDALAIAAQALAGFASGTGQRGAIAATPPHPEPLGARLWRGRWRGARPHRTVDEPHLHNRLDSHRLRDHRDHRQCILPARRRLRIPP